MKRSANHLIKIFFLGILLLNIAPSWSQQISIDRGLRMQGLWCFPLITDSLTYQYLPDRAYLSLDERKHPQFSFIRYVTDKKYDSSSEESISDANGGAVLHFLVTYDTDEKKVADAQQGLKEHFGNDSVKLRGPIVFKEGRFALVSSILNPADGKTERKVMAMGAAPVLQGSRLAFSFELEPERSKLLLESFKMTTPDISLIFDMVFGGLSDAYNAKLTVNWSEVQKNEKISGGINVYFVSADVEKICEELRKSNAVKLETSGEDSRMEGLVTNAYTKIVDMLFRKIEPEQLPADQQSGLAGMLGGMFGSGGAMSSSKTFGFGAHFGYKLKDVKMSGVSIMTFNSRTSSDRHHYISFNIGDIYKKYGKDPNYFKTVSLMDPDFQQREITVGVDGALLPEFDKMINNITVTMKKDHENGTTTLKEVNIQKSTILENRKVGMTYGSISDADRLAWLDYDYKAQYNFKGGKTYQTNWTRQNASMINLFAPYERRVVRLEGDAEVLKAKNVRAITVRIEYPFFGETRSMESTVKPEENFTQKQFEVTLPAGLYSYKYTLRWRMRDGTEKVYSHEDDAELIFIDMMP